MLWEHVCSLEASIGQLDQRLQQLEAGKKAPRDFWDKLTATSGIITGSASLVSGLLIAGIGFYATNVYNERARQAERDQKDRATIAAELQAVEKFFPHLTSDREQTKAGAIIAISLLGNTELAANLARHFGGPGARDALTTIATASPVGSAVRATAEAGLLDLYSQYRRSVAFIDVQRGSTPQFRLSGILVSSAGYILTSALAFPDSSGKPEPWRISVRLGASNDPPLHAELIRVEKDTQLALIKLRDGTNIPAPVITKAKELVPGERVTILGFHEFGFFSTAGTVMGSGPEGTFLLDASVGLGSLGSPVFDANGQVVAVISGRLVDTRSAVVIPIQRARPLLAMPGLN